MDSKLFEELNNSIVINGICMNDGNQYCNLGYACDACPYNLDQEIEERLQTGL
jgi:hypothetical protein